MNINLIREFLHDFLKAMAIKEQHEKEDTDRINKIINKLYMNVDARKEIKDNHVGQDEGHTEQV